MSDEKIVKDRFTPRERELGRLEFFPATVHPGFESLFAGIPQKLTA